MFSLIPRSRGREELFTQLAKSFDEAFNHDFFAPFNTGLQPIRSDIRETNEAYVIEAELPGFRKEDITIDYAKPYLTIQAVRNDESQDDRDHQMVRSERRYGAYTRRYAVDQINEDAIDASLKDGVLTLVLPKQEKTKVNRIEIRG